MKAVILAAGKGVRMLPLTADKPKVLVAVNGKPFLSYVLENVRRAGFTDIAIIAGYKKDKIEEYVRKHDPKITIIEQKELKGTADAVMAARPFVGSQNFVVINGDNLFSPADLKNIQKDDDFIYIAGKKVENPERYGVLVCEGDKLAKIAEKPKQFMGNLVNVGLYKFTFEIFEALENISLSERGELELTDALSLLAKKGKVRVLMLQDYWLDLGRKEDVEKVGEFLLRLG